MYKKAVCLLFGGLLTVTSADASPIIVELTTVYPNGDRRMIVLEETEGKDVFWEKYEEWQITDFTQKHVALRKQVGETSPLDQLSGYYREE